MAPVEHGYTGGPTINILNLQSMDIQGDPQLINCTCLAIQGAQNETFLIDLVSTKIKH